MNQNQLMRKARKELAGYIRNREERLSRCDLGYHVKRCMTLSDGSYGFYCSRCGKLLGVKSCEQVDLEAWHFVQSNPVAYGECAERVKRHERRMREKMERNSNRKNKRR